MTEDLFTAIYSLYLASGLPSSLTGGWWSGRIVGDSIAYPYVLVSMVGRSHRDLDLESLRIQVDLYQAASTELGVAAALSDAVVAALDGQILGGPLSGKNIGLDMVYEMGPIAEQHYWRTTIDFETGVERA